MVKGFILVKNKVKRDTKRKKIGWTLEMAEIELTITII